jgi:hypothetical protein
MFRMNHFIIYNQNGYQPKLKFNYCHDGNHEMILSKLLSKSPKILEWKFRSEKQLCKGLLIQTQNREKEHLGAILVNNLSRRSNFSLL